MDTMGLHFIFGRAGTGKTERCCREIREYVAEHPERKAFLLVPDQGTYTAEYRLAESFPEKGFTNVTVCGFSRLAYRVFQELHSPVSDALSPLGQQIILRRLLEENKGHLKMIMKAASQPHFSEELTGFFHQLDMFCVSEEDLENAAAAQGDSPLGRKMADLALLYRAYHCYLKDHFDYQGSLFDLLAREIPKSPTLSSSRIWIDGFNGMAPQKIHIVYALLHTAEEVTMTLQMDRPEEAVMNPNFSRPFHLFSLLSAEERHFSSVTLSEDCRFSSPHLKAVARSFFNRRPERCCLPKAENPVPDEGLHLITASHRAEEVDFISRTILSLVRDRHLRFRDILVLLRNPEDYVDAFERSFKRYEIPGFIDRKHPMNNHPLVVLLSSLVRFLTSECSRKNSGWQRETIFRMLKTFLLPEWKEEDVDRLENYVLSHGIRPWQYHEPWEFRTYRDLDAPAPPLSEKEQAELIEANEWRSRLTAMLDGLAEKWSQSPRVKDRCRLLYQWMMDKKIPDTLCAMDEGEMLHTNLRPHLQVWKKILSLLDEIVHTAGDDEISEKNFLSIFEDGLSALTYSTIPPTLDHVTVTGMDRGYAMEADAVFIPGAVEGEFPRRVEEGGFFTELERQKIFKDSRLIFGESLLEEVHKEQFFTYLALTRAEKALYITMPSVNDDHNDTEPSFLISQLRRLGYASEERALTPEDRERDHTYFANPRQALSLLPAILREKMPEENSPWAGLVRWAKDRGYENDITDALSGFRYKNEAPPLPGELAERLFKPGGRFFGSVTRFESYRRCPFMYFVRYGLKIDKRDEGEMESLDFGNYLHAGLHQFGEALSVQKKQWRDATDEDIQNLSETIASRLAPKVRYGALHADGASRYTERALNETFRRSLTALRKWSQNSSFDTKALEKEFYLHLSGEKDTFTLNGKIDRIDSDGRAVAIFDYKTGNTTATLQEAVAGLKLQLLTYLLDVEEEGDEGLLPAALMYIYLSGDIKSLPAVPPGGTPPMKDRDNTSGWILSDADTVRRLDSAAGEEDSFLPVKFTTKGALTQTASTLSADDFKNLLTIVKRKLLEIYHRMEKGNIPIRPVRYRNQVPCTYCPYHAICRFDPKGEGESYDYVNLPTDRELKKQLAELAEDRPQGPEGSEGSKGSKGSEGKVSP